MRDLRYGIEIEMTGLSRGKEAETLAGFFGTRAEHTGGGYDAYACLLYTSAMGKQNGMELSRHPGIWSCWRGRSKHAAHCMNRTRGRRCAEWDIRRTQIYLSLIHI